MTLPGLAALLALSIGSLGDAPKPPADFPASWVGHWRGEAKLVGGPKPQAFTMELIVRPTEKPDVFGWTIVYDGAAGRQERRYKLLVKDAARGEYAIDEDNGIILDARYLDGALYSHFLVQGTRIVTRERLEAEGTPDAHIRVEMLTTLDARANTTGNKDGAPEVKTWMPLSLQQAKLKRVPR